MMLDTRTFKLLQNILKEAWGVCFQYFESPKRDLTSFDMGIRKELSHSKKHYASISHYVSNITYGKIYVLFDQLQLYTVLFKSSPKEKGFYAMGPFCLAQDDAFFASLRKYNHLNTIPTELKLLLQNVPTNFSRGDAITMARNILELYCNIEDPQVEELNMLEEIEPITLKEDINIKAKRIEENWEHGDRIIQYIKEGNENKALLEASFFLHSKLDQRLDNLFFSTQTLLYSTNTLFCRAARSNNIHPIFCDEISTKYAKKLERCTSISQLHNLYTEMIHDYCELCKSQSAVGYSFNTYKVIHYIQLNINQDLSLHSIAKAIGFSSSYLSRSFKKETGMTITQYINKKRIDLATRLLKSTSLTIREISQECGVSDFNYFTKIFYKEIGSTPLEFRKGIQSHK